MAATQREVDVIESWEDVDGTDVIERQFSKLLAKSKTNSRPGNGSGSSPNPVKIILTGDDALRTQYVPSEPTVKILKRPSKDCQSHNDNKVFHPKKTLQQREQEYAEARLRIMGEPLAEKLDEKLSIQNKTKPSEQDNVIRYPKGPDGSSGFKVRR